MSKAGATIDSPEVLAQIVSTLQKMEERLGAAMPKPVQQMSAEAFAKVDLPRPSIPTFQNGLPIDLRGVKEPVLSTTLRQLGEIPSGTYLDGVIRVTRTEPTHNTDGRLDIRYDASTTEKRMLYYSMARTFSELVDLMWREARAAKGA